MGHIITDQTAIDQILERGTIVDILPTKQLFRDKLMSGEKMRFYIGFDATAPTLHLSHAKNFILLEKFRKLGHEVIVLFGDFTARIGDPSGESSARKQLTREEVVANVASWKNLIQPLMDFNDTQNPPLIRYNHDWLSKLTLEDVIHLASNVTVQQMIERDMFQRRIKEGNPIHLHEFLYPLMQGYDSVAMDVDVELCGTDQTFNALVGRTLQRKLNNREKFVVAVTLMANPKTGALMSKSKGTGVFLHVSPSEMYGQVMAQPDEMIEILFVNNTTLSLEEIAGIIKDNGPKEAKMRLAFEITALFHGKKEAENAQESFVSTFQKGEIPADIPECIAEKEEALVECMMRAGIVSSKSEWRRLVEEQAVMLLDDEERIVDPNVRAQSGTYKIGKRRFIKIAVQ